MKQGGLLSGSTIFFFSSILVFLARFAISVIVARSLGPAGKGVYTLVLTYASFLVFILDFGLSSSLTYLVASRQFRQNELSQFAIYLSLVTGGLGCLVFYGLYRVVLADNLLAGVDPGYINLVLAIVPFNLLASLLSAVLLGTQAILTYNVINIGRVLLNLVLQCVSALSQWGISGAIWAWAISNLFALALAIWYLRQGILSRLTGFGAILKSALSYGVKGYTANLLTLFNYRLDTFILNNFAGSGAVGLYATGVAAAELIWYLPNAISSTLFPKSASLDQQTGARLTAKVCRVLMLIILPLAIGFGVLGVYLIPLVYGMAFQASVAPFLLLMPGIIGVAITKIIAANLSGTGKPQFAAYTAAIVFLITIALDLALIPKYTLAGAAVASSIAYLAGAVLSVYWFSRETHITWSAVTLPTRADLSELRSLSADLLAQARQRLIGREGS